MDEQILKEMAATLHDIKERLTLSPAAAIAGPADPAPDWSPHVIGPIRQRWLRGPVADPAPWYLLDKASLARLKIHRLDGAISELEKEIGSLKLERDLLKREYKIK